MQGLHKPPAECNFFLFAIVTMSNFFHKTVTPFSYSLRSILTRVVL